MPFLTTTELQPQWVQLILKIMLAQRRPPTQKPPQKLANIGFIFNSVQIRPWGRRQSNRRLYECQNGWIIADGRLRPRRSDF